MLLLSTNIAAIVLAGGKSTRLGQDKACLRLNGNEELQTAIFKQLKSSVDEVYIVGRIHPEHPSFIDEHSGKGPLGGIVTALKALQKDCLVLSCDLPYISAKAITGLIDCWNKRPAGTLAACYQNAVSSKLEPLVAIYAFEALELLESNLKSGMAKLTANLKLLKLSTIPYSAEDAWQFINLNTPADLQEYEILIKKK